MLASLLGATVALTLVTASPAIYERPAVDESGRHVATGAGAGAAAMGACAAFFMLRQKVKATRRGWDTRNCYAFTLGLSGGLFTLKEALYDPYVHGDGSITDDGVRDFAEDMGGSAFGALLFVPVVSW